MQVENLLAAFLFAFLSSRFLSSSSQLQPLVMFSPPLFSYYNPSQYPGRIGIFHSRYILTNTQMILFWSIVVSFYFLVRYIAENSLFRFKWFKILNRHDQLDVRSRTVSTIHAIISTFWSIQIISHSMWWPKDVKSFHGPRALLDNPDAILLIIHTCGYLFYDAIDMHLNKSIGDTMSFLHHYGYILFTIGSVFYNQGVYYLAIFVVTEATTPFVNLRFFFAINGIKGPIYALNGVFLWILWVGLRIYYSNSLAFISLYDEFHYLATHASSLTILLIICGFLLILVLNFTWGYLITRAVFKAAWKSLIGKTKGEKPSSPHQKLPTPTSQLKKSQ